MYCKKRILIYNWAELFLINDHVGAIKEKDCLKINEGES